jgi:predicted metalloendopeptidase
MKKWIAVTVAAALTVACSQEAASPREAAPAAPLRAGVDIAAFDTSVRPQDDIYKYVNGAWLAKTEIPADRGAYGGFYEAIDHTQDRLKEIVEGAAKNAGSDADLQKLGAFYTAFMNEARANELGRTPLEP